MENYNKIQLLQIKLNINKLFGNLGLEIKIKVLIKQ